jgi:outer membrane scaffolding protein for murein synthesis (MipA/OmpV family)
MMSKWLVTGAAALGLFTASSAWAGDWIATIGARASVAPPYEGSTAEVVRPFPTFSLRPADRPYRFTPPDGGTTFAVIDTDHFVFGPMARFQYERKPQGPLKGLDKVDWAAEPGAFLEIWPTRWLRGRVEARRGVTGHQGFVGDAGIDLVRTGRRWDASIGGRMGWGDDDYMGTYFGVTPQEAARNPVINQAYDPSGGRRYWGVELAAAYHLDERWKITADAGYHRLAKQPSDSPIVRLIGDPNQYFGSVGVSYSFDLHL